MAVVGKLTSDGQTPRRRRRRLRSLAFVPTLLTIGNLLCGFAAIHFGLRAMMDFGAGVPPEQVETLKNAAWERVLPSFLAIGAGLVLIGMVLDCFDGLIARVTRSTTNFGGQLDSLADVVTFGAAPATLMVAFMTKELAGDSIIPSPLSDDFWGRLTWVSAAVYVAFGAVRLARYNVEHAEVGFDHKTFRGMPIPGAASVLVALIIFQEQQGVAVVRTALVYAMPAIAIALALLMVSRIPYRRLNRSTLVGRRPFGQLPVVVLVLAIFIASPAPTLLVVTVVYGMSGPATFLARRLRANRAPATQDSPQSKPGDRQKLG
jgi:CDP-diacylglycerol--serine O-phosphatidyltransferase